MNRREKLAFDLAGLSLGHGGNGAAANSYVAGALIQAILTDRITELECAMPVCLCPSGRKFFEPKGAGSRWQPTADRFPVTGYEGGGYTFDNVRLAHMSCNISDATIRHNQGRRTDLSSARASRMAKSANCKRWHVARGRACSCEVRSA